MKEITEIMTVQITAIAKLTEEQLDKWEEVREERIKLFLAAIKEDRAIDDVLLLDSKRFIADVAQAE